MLVSLGLTLLVSHLSFKWVEQPMMRLARTTPPGTNAALAR